MPSLPQIDGWIRRLNDEGRLEIYLRVTNVSGMRDRKIRASGPADEMMELVEWFEEKTGMRVSSPVLPRKAPKPIPGQLDLTLGELSSDATVAG